jgi:hypothetical protein
VPVTAQEVDTAPVPEQAIESGEDADSEPELVVIGQVQGIARTLEVEIVLDEDIESRSDREGPSSAKDREPSVDRKLGRGMVLEIARFGR